MKFDFVKTENWRRDLTTRLLLRFRFRFIIMSKKKAVLVLDLDFGILSLTHLNFIIF